MTVSASSSNATATATGGPHPTAATLEQLRDSGWRSRSVKTELRENLTAAMLRGEELFPGIVGYEETVIPELVHAILAEHDILFLGEKGQGKSRLMRLIPRFLDAWTPHLDIPRLPRARGSRAADHPGRPRTAGHL